MAVASAIGVVGAAVIGDLVMRKTVVGATVTTITSKKMARSLSRVIFSMSICVMMREVDVVVGASIVVFGDTIVVAGVVEATAIEDNMVGVMTVGTTVVG